jgi:septal ring factor EnvC (AmiA/AmiB activator)
MTQPTTTPPPAATIPPIVVEWKGIASICIAVLLAFGGGYLALVKIIYDGLDHRIFEVQSNVSALNAAINSASKDAGAFQQLMSEAPDLKKQIQETHDEVLKHTARFDNLDVQIKTMNASLTDISNRMISMDRRLPGGDKR